MSFNLKKLQYISGSKVLIAIGFLMALNPFWLIFAIPFFLIGVIGILTSKRKVNDKIRWIAFPLILWFPCMLGFLKIGSMIKKAYAQKIEFVIPKDFNGCVSVCFPAPFGQKKIIRNGREVILVPQSGIVFYSGKIEDGYFDWNYRVNGEVIEGNKAHHMIFSPSSGGSVQFTIGHNPMRYSFRNLLAIRENNLENQDSLQRVLESMDSIIQRCFIENKDLINK